MTVDEATTRLKAMTAWDTDPTLESAEIDTLVNMSKLADVYGLWPSDTGWTPTFNLNIGAAEGWRWKAARVEGLTDGGGTVTSIQVGDVRKTFANADTPQQRYLKNANDYQKKITGTVRTGKYANPLIMPTEILP